MKQVLQTRRSGETVVRTVPHPACPPGGVLVRTAFSAISSGTERARVELSQKSLVGKARERPDLVRAVWRRARREGMTSTLRVVRQRLAEETPVGYSCAGTVIEVGEHVRGLLPGDQVACAGGAAGHAEVVAVPANLCARVPEGVPLPSAAVTTIAAVALHAIRLADVQVGGRAAVIGCGLVGQIAVRLLRAAGVETFAVDVDPRQLERARAGGAADAFLSGPDAARRLRLLAEAGVDGVVVTAASRTSEPLALACEIARDRGAVVLVGAVPIEFPRAPLYEKELRFRVSRSYGPGRYDPEYEERGLDYPLGHVRWTEQRNMEAVLRLQAQGLLSLSELVEIVPVQDAPAAYARLTGDPATRPSGALVLAYGAAAATEAPAAGATPKPVRSGAGVKTGIGPARVRVGLIGPGSFAGRTTIPALEAAGAELIVAGGGAGPSAAAAARNGTVRRVAATPAAVIADPQVDAVVICTRHGDHAALTAAALAAGKHVFCEKPLALTLDERDTAMEAASTAPGTLTVGFNRRFSPLLEEMRVFLEPSPAPMTLIYRVAAGPLPADHWAHDLAQGGGRALGETCHFLDSLAFVVGAPVIEVHAAGHAPQSRPAAACDNLVVAVRFADASVASLVYVADGSLRVPKERVEGFRGHRTAILDDYVALDLHDDGRPRRRRAPSQDKGHRREIAAFVRAVQTGEPAMALAEIDNVTLATLAVVESLRTGQPVRLPTVERAR